MNKAEKSVIKAGYKPGYTSEEHILSYMDGYNHAIEEVFEFLKKNYLIKSIEPLRWVSWDKVKSDYLNQ